MKTKEQKCYKGVTDVLQHAKSAVHSRNTCTPSPFAATPERVAPPLLICSHCVFLGSQSALEPDLQAKRAGAGENTQSAEHGAGITGTAGGLQNQRSPERGVPQPTTICSE